MIKHLHIKTIFLLVAVLGIVCSCEESELLEEKEAGTDTKVITINGLADPEFMALAAPFTSNAVAGRVLEDSDFQKVKKLTGNGYVTYTVPISSLNNAPSASHSLVMSLRDDTVRYNLLEIIPDKSWNGKFEAFTGSINTYLIEFSKQKKNIAGKELNKAHVDDCYVFVIDEVIVHADLSATAVGHWEHKDSCVDGGGGGGYSDGGYYWVPDWGSGDSGNWSDGGSTGSGGSGTSGDYEDPKYEEVPISLEEALIELWEAKIDDSQLKPCMQNIMTDLKNLTKGVGSIVQKFAGLDPGYNWKTQDGTLPVNTNAQTSTAFNTSTGTVTTTFDTNKFGNATDLSVARTILHEAVHAYVVAVTYNNISNATQRQAILGPNWINAFINNGHLFIATDFVNDIANALKEYGQNRGYSLSNQFYEDLAWGGLTHYDPNNSNNFVESPWFKNAFPSSTDRNRILNVINAEQNGTYQKKGNNAGC